MRRAQLFYLRVLYRDPRFSDYLSRQYLSAPLHALYKGTNRIWRLMLQPKQLPLSEVDPIKILMESLFDVLSTLEFCPRFFDIRIG
jgi:hypothetical protein